MMRDYGYHPTQAAQKRPRNGTYRHSAHLLAFTHTGDINTGDSIRPEIVLYNSHDGSSSVKLFAGAYRFICSNGIVAGEGFNAKLYHNKSAMKGFEDMLKGIIDSMPKLLTTIDNMRNTQLDGYQRRVLAEKMVQTRWSMLDEENDVVINNGVYATPATVMNALASKRADDDYQDAWTVFNRIQENVLRGGLLVKSFKDDGSTSVWRKSRPITSVSEHTRINSAMFDLALA